MEAPFQNFHIIRISAVLSYKKSLSLAITSNRILDFFCIPLVLPVVEWPTYCLGMVWELPQGCTGTVGPVGGSGNASAPPQTIIPPFPYH